MEINARLTAESMFVLFLLFGCPLRVEAAVCCKLQLTSCSATSIIVGVDADESEVGFLKNHNGSILAAIQLRFVVKVEYAPRHR